MQLFLKFYYRISSWSWGGTYGQYIQYNFVQLYSILYHFCVDFYVDLFVIKNTDAAGILNFEQLSKILIAYLE